MFYDLLNVLFGILLGVIIGIIPSFHINNLSALLLKVNIETGYDLFYLLLASSSSFIIGSFLATILYKVPDENTLYVPHLMRFIKVRGIDNFIIIGLYGFSFGLLINTIFLPLSYYFIKNIYYIILPYLKYVLLGYFVFYIILHPKIKYFVFIILSSLLGYITLNELNMNYNFALMPLFIGFYSLPYLIISLKNYRTHLKLSKKIKTPPKKELLKSSFIGYIVGLLGATIPAIPPIAFLFFIPHNKKSLSKYIAVISSMSISDNILSLLSATATGNSRSGVGIMLNNMKETSIVHVLILIILSAISLYAIYLIYRKIIDKKIIEKITSVKIYYLVIFIIFFEVIVLTGIIGIAIMILSSALSYYGMKMKLTPTVYMFSLITPLLINML